MIDQSHGMTTYISTGSGMLWELYHYPKGNGPFSLCGELEFLREGYYPGPMCSKCVSIKADQMRISRRDQIAAMTPEELIDNLIHAVTEDNPTLQPYEDAVGLYWEIETDLL